MHHLHDREGIRDDLIGVAPFFVGATYTQYDWLAVDLGSVVTVTHIVAAKEYGAHQNRVRDIQVKFETGK